MLALEFVEYVGAENWQNMVGRMTGNSRM